MLLALATAQMCCVSASSRGSSHVFNESKQTGLGESRSKIPLVGIKTTKLTKVLSLAESDVYLSSPPEQAQRSSTYYR
jgi:hypothetical protein